MYAATTAGVSEFELTSNLALGEYTIVVSNYEALKKVVRRYEVLDPDGFSIGQLASEVGAASKGVVSYWNWILGQRS